MSGFAGTLGERVALERPDPARDTIGGATGAWIAEGVAAAAVVPAGDGWRITLRRPCAVEEGWRLAWAGRVLRVTAVRADPRRPDRIVLTAEVRR